MENKYEEVILAISAVNKEYMFSPKCWSRVLQCIYQFVGLLGDLNSLNYRISLYISGQLHDRYFLTHEVPNKLQSLLQQSRSEQVLSTNLALRSALAYASPWARTLILLTDSEELEADEIVNLLESYAQCEIRTICTITLLSTKKEEDSLGDILNSPPTLTLNGVKFYHVSVTIDMLLYCFLCIFALHVCLPKVVLNTDCFLLHGLHRPDISETVRQVKTLTHSWMDPIQCFVIRRDARRLESMELYFESIDSCAKVKLTETRMIGDNVCCTSGLMYWKISEHCVDTSIGDIVKAAEIKPKDLVNCLNSLNRAGNNLDKLSKLFQHRSPLHRLLYSWILTARQSSTGFAKSPNVHHQLEPKCNVRQLFEAQKQKARQVAPTFAGYVPGEKKHKLYISKADVS